MKKLLSSFYLWITVLLLAGMNGNAHASGNSSSVDKQPVQLTIASDYSLNSVTRFINYSRLHFEKQTESILSLDTEKEEETREFSLHKYLIEKKLTAGDYAFLSNKYSPVAEISDNTFTKICPSVRYFHTLSSKQYILYDVFRI